MKKRKRRIIAVLLCWMLCGTTASGAVQEGEVTTTIRSGEVRIRMHRYGDGEKEKGWEDLEHILPGQKITMITEIENLGENCLIRYQMTAEAKSNREIPISSFSGIPGNCVRKGRYFYHTDVVKHGETVRLLQHLLYQRPGNREGRMRSGFMWQQTPFRAEILRRILRLSIHGEIRSFRKYPGKRATSFQFDTPERNVPGRAGRRRHHQQYRTRFSQSLEHWFQEMSSKENFRSITGAAGRKMYTGSWRQRKNFFWNRRNFGWKRKMVRFSAKEVLRNNPWGNLLSLKRMNKMRKKISYSFSVFRKTWIIHTVCGSPHLPGRFGQCQRILRFRQDRSRSKPGRTVM
ncbi:MAG: hypothetical protein ACLUUO_15495 [Sellimonas intestinalis]